MNLTRKVIVSVLVTCCGAMAQTRERAISWRAATAQELAGVLPARAQVLHERIETEVESNSGITDEHAHFIAATVLITAGYAAHGKYSHFLLVQAPMKLDNQLTLGPGNYLIGWERGEDGLNVHLYRAESGDEVGKVEAHPSATHITVVSIRIWPPRERSLLQIGRFVIPYQLP